MKGFQQAGNASLSEQQKDDYIKLALLRHQKDRRGRRASLRVHYKGSKRQGRKAQKRHYDFVCSERNRLQAIISNVREVSAASYHPIHFSRNDQAIVATWVESVEDILDSFTASSNVKKDPINCITEKLEWLQKSYLCLAEAGRDAKELIDNWENDGIYDPESDSDDRSDTDSSQSSDDSFDCINRSTANFDFDTDSTNVVTESTEKLPQLFHVIRRQAAVRTIRKGILNWVRSNSSIQAKIEENENFGHTKYEWNTEDFIEAEVIEKCDAKDANDGVYLKYLIPNAKHIATFSIDDAIRNIISCSKKREVIRSTCASRIQMIWKSSRRGFLMFSNIGYEVVTAIRLKNRSKLKKLRSFCDDEYHGSHETAKVESIKRSINRRKSGNSSSKNIHALENNGKKTGKIHKKPLNKYAGKVKREKSLSSCSPSIDIKQDEDIQQVEQTAVENLLSMESTKTGSPEHGTVSPWGHKPFPGAQTLVMKNENINTEESRNTNAKDVIKILEDRIQKLNDHLVIDKKKKRLSLTSECIEKLLGSQNRRNEKRNVESIVEKGIQKNTSILSDERVDNITNNLSNCTTKSFEKVLDQNWNSKRNDSNCKVSMNRPKFTNILPDENDEIGVSNVKSTTSLSPLVYADNIRKENINSIKNEDDTLSGDCADSFADFKTDCNEQEFPLEKRHTIFARGVNHHCLNNTQEAEVVVEHCQKSNPDVIHDIQCCNNSKLLQPFENDGHSTDLKPLNVPTHNRKYFRRRKPYRYQYKQWTAKNNVCERLPSIAYSSIREYSVNAQPNAGVGFTNIPIPLQTKPILYNKDPPNSGSCFGIRHEYTTQSEENTLNNLVNRQTEFLSSSDKDNSVFLNLKIGNTQNQEKVFVQALRKTVNGKSIPRRRVHKPKRPSGSNSGEQLITRARKTVNLGGSTSPCVGFETETDKLQELMDAYFGLLSAYTQKKY